MIALFYKMQPNESTLPSRDQSASVSGTKKQELVEEIKNKGDKVDVYNEVIKEIVVKKEVPQTIASPI